MTQPILFSAARTERGTHLIVMVMGNGDGYIYVYIFISDMLNSLLAYTVFEMLYYVFTFQIISLQKYLIFFFF